MLSVTESKLMNISKTKFLVSILWLTVKTFIEGKLLEISRLSDCKIASLETVVTIEPMDQFHPYWSHFAQKQEF